MLYNRDNRVRISLAEELARDAISYTPYHTPKFVSHTLYGTLRESHIIPLLTSQCSEHSTVFLLAATPLPDSHYLHFYIH